MIDSAGIVREAIFRQLHLRHESAGGSQRTAAGVLSRNVPFVGAAR